MSPIHTCVIYARKSTDREDLQILSIDGQLRELRAFAERNGFSITTELTESCSAREPGRPVFSKLLSDASAGKIQRILAWKLDRLARNPVDGGALIHVLGKGRLEEIVTPEGTYSGTGDSKFMLAVLFGAATKMTDDLAAGVRRGNRDLCSTGRIPGRAPLGYLKVRDRPGFRGAGKVVPDPERFPLVRQLWLDLISGTVTASDAWRRAMKAGLTTRTTAGRAGSPVKLAHVFTILKNPFYTGIVRHGAEIYVGEHEPMISSSQFEQAQRLLHRVNAPRPSKHDFLFRGLLTCGECGGERAMVAEQHTTTAGNCITYYRCGRRRPGYPQCYSKPISEVALIDATLTTLRHISLPEEIVKWTLDAVDWRIVNDVEREFASTVSSERQLAEVEATLKRLTDLVVSGVLSEAEYLKRTQVAKLQLIDLRARCSNVGHEQRQWREAVAKMLESANGCAEAFEAAGTEARRTILTRLYANVSISHRIPQFSLTLSHSALRNVAEIRASFPKRYANLPHPSECWQPSKKAARRSRLVAALSLWCTRLEEVRTKTRAVVAARVSL